MGFILKTTFWLGLVYYAMPLGTLPVPALQTASATDTAICSVASAALLANIGAPDSYRDVATKGCTVMAAAGEAIRAPDAAPTRGKTSANTLTAADRKLAWQGPHRPKAG